MKIVGDRDTGRRGAKGQIEMVVAGKTLITSVFQSFAHNAAKGVFHHLVVFHQIVGHSVAIEARSGAWVNGSGRKSWVQFRPAG